MNRTILNTGYALLIGSMALQVGCGGSSGGGDGSTTGTTQPGTAVGGSTSTGGRQLSDAEIDNLKLKGVWRQAISATSEFSNSSELFGGFTFDSTSSITGGSVISLDYTDSTTLQDDCDQDGVFEFLTEDPEDEADEPFLCENGQEESFRVFEVSTSEYRIEISCTNESESTLVFTKLSDGFEFDFGEVVFNSDDHDNLVANQGVCGRTFSTAQTTVYNGDAPELEQLQADNGETARTEVKVRAPYQDGFLHIDLIFAKGSADESLSDRTFNVVPAFPTESGEVIIELNADAFGEFDFPDELLGDSGTVTVTQINQFDAQAAFDIITDSGNVVTGSFNFNLK